ncbi:hypothetical protein GW813_00475 [bacterium]|nr:hypothetical protein [bacterium]PIV81127.1 MAG: hypothetical protein COW53_06075 [bacterium CG17_big_fil_post_rev_8_21_14_2_50_64_8]PJA75864.1 MAG: hypothetical protein CO151_04875 [bacterium CG_4_9_14_3_um_filter_65_15]
MRLFRILGALVSGILVSGVLVLILGALLIGGGSRCPRPVLTEPGPARFGRFAVRPGDTIAPPDFSLRVYGILYRYDWPEARLMFEGDFPVSVTEQAAGEVDFFPLDGYRERMGIGGDYAGLRIFVREIGRDHVVVDIDP